MLKKIKELIKRVADESFDKVRKEMDEIYKKSLEDFKEEIKNKGVL